MKKPHNKPQLRIHTHIDDDFQIRSSIDHEDIEVAGSGNNTVIENEDLAELTGTMGKAALQSF